LARPKQSSWLRAEAQTMGDPLTIEADLPPEALRLPAPRYKLKQRLAEGGMAEVFLASERGVAGFEKLVVIKRILPHLSSNAEFVQMLTTEAHIMARLSHPNIVQVYELGEMDQQYFISMEFVHGEDLRRIRGRLEQLRRRIPLGFACRVVADILAGLDYAHRQRDVNGAPLGLVHRDVSPSNVLVSYEGGVKLVDFGIAKSNLLQTHALQMKGKFSYMSPEQVQRQKLDGRSDVYAAGIVLWELIRGVPLFRRDNIENTIRAVLDAPVPSLCAHDPTLPPQLDAIVQRALARPLEKRYPSAKAMREDLERLMRKEQLESDALSIRSTMHELFADELRRQVEDMQSAGRHSVVDYLLWAAQDTSIAWIGRSATERTPSWPAAPRTETGAAPPSPSPLEVTDGQVVAIAPLEATRADQPRARRPPSLPALPSLPSPSLPEATTVDDPTLLPWRQAA
jgi:serine/threonine-protein kinase